MKFGENKNPVIYITNPGASGVFLYFAASKNQTVMKKILTIVAIALLSTSVFAQTKKGTTKTAALKPSSQHIKLFELAVASGDMQSAITGLNYYISENGDKNNYADTLAMLYMQEGMFGQCYYWANKRLEQKPDDNTLLEMKGICLDKLQQPKEAIDIFEKLFAKTKSPYHGYKLMELQYSIKRLAECVATAMAAEKLEYKPSFLMTYNIGQQTGRTYLQAGVFNIHALALYDLDKKAEAKSYFEKALSLDSTFALAKQNLEALKSLEAGAEKKAAPSNEQPAASPAIKQKEN
jgi:tetratricopeptide (TPR) repeat protein